MKSNRKITDLIVIEHKGKSGRIEYNEKRKERVTDLNRKQGRSENKVNIQKEKTVQWIEKRVEKDGRMDKKGSRKEHRKEQKEQITTDF